VWDNFKDGYADQIIDTPNHNYIPNLNTSILKKTIYSPVDYEKNRLILSKVHLHVVLFYHINQAGCDLSLNWVITKYLQFLMYIYVGQQVIPDLEYLWHLEGMQRK
jgi:hypothetical protein